MNAEFEDALYVAAVEAAAPAAETGGWRDISSFDPLRPATDDIFDFWLDWAPDTAALNAPLLPSDMSRLHRGRYRSWSSLYRATHWRHLPAPPGFPAIGETKV